MQENKKTIINEIYDYSKLDKRVDNIITKVFCYINNPNKEYIKTQIYKAYLYARDAHEGQKRLSGEPYIFHPVAATEILVTLQIDIHTIQACLLHDVIEDTSKTEENIREEFGQEVAFLCVGMEKLSNIRYQGEIQNIGNLRKMFIAMAEDLRIILIKLSDRLHNMQTLKFHPKKNKRKKIALETLNIYSPIAYRLGLYHIKNGLDEECFKILNPKEYNDLKKQLSELEKNKKEFLTNITNEFDVLLKGHIENYEIDHRIKSIYSIYRKLKKKELKYVKDLYDLFGIRIILHTEEECYKVLGLVHSKWTPIPNRFKDYIALPKPNGYRSLHTTIMGLLKKFRRQPTDIQIKTFDMKKFSDIGIASHFVYKEGGEKSIADIVWVKELKELIQNLGDNDFVGSLKVDIFRDRIFVFTPKGDLVDLPVGSTAIDFAYYLHTDLGNHIILAKVNRAIYSLDKELHNGDVVEISTDKTKKPSPFWLSFVKTLKAKNNIKLYLKKENKGLHRERGKDMVNKYLQNAGMKIFDKELHYLKILDGKEYSIEERWLLLEQVGNFSITPATLLKRIIKYQNFIGKNELKKANTKKTIGSKKINNFHNKSNIIIGGEENINYILGNCCKKHIPKGIIGHINNKGVITIHKKNCTILKNINKDRLLFAYIKGTQDDVISVGLTLQFRNQKGIFKNISDIIYTMNINVEEMYMKTLDYNCIEIKLKLLLLDYEYYIIERFLDRLKLHFHTKFIDSKIDYSK